MAGFDVQLKERAKELKSFFKKGMHIIRNSCKKGSYKVRNLRQLFLNHHPKVIINVEE